MTSVGLWASRAARRIACLVGRTSTGKAPAMTILRPNPRRSFRWFDREADRNNHDLDKE
ncbi:MAG: hypothetical protein OXG81_11870 [Acidobacteria bacterium]|nr:hypothetical protein [Acidobacteriota bacterium]